jgi:hypothetical protein
MGECPLGAAAWDVGLAMVKNMTDFELWLEFEIGDPGEPGNRATENFTNMVITLSDGRRYCLTVWTFDFLPLARHPWPYEKNADEVPAKYVIPPDLFVERLDRTSIQAIVSDMLAAGELRKEWLCTDAKDVSRSV